MTGKRVLVGLMLWPLAVWGQKPVISTVVNAASYSRSFTSSGVHNITAGSIATIFGTNLAASTQTANTVPLPISLGGAKVVFQGIAAPLFYVSPSQINFQAPSNALGNNGGIVVTTSTGSSDPYLLQGTDSALGIFTLDGSGCGQGLISNVSSDGTVSLNSMANSISPGEYLTVYGTGLFIQAYKPTDGSAAPSYPLARSDSTVVGVFDSAIDDTFDSYFSNFWSGLAPGMIGVDQMNVRVPETTREGCAVPFQVLAATEGNISQPVTLAVRQGGGACVDPPVAGYGQITWEKAVNTTAAGAAETDTVTVSLQAAPGMQPPSLLSPALETNVYYFGASCPIPGYRSLDAGTVTVQGSGFGPVTAPVAPLQKGQVSGLTVYQAALPAGSIQSGKFTAAATGGADAGGFRATTQIGPEIQFATALEGTSFPCYQSVKIGWTGGDPSAWVTVRQVFPSWDSYSFDHAFQARVSDGTISVPNVNNPCKIPGSPIKLVIEVTPDPSEVAAFSAPGLSLGGTLLWKYTYTFDAFLSAE